MEINNKEIKVAIVHDFLVQYGGAERVLKALTEIFPEAPIYTLLYDKDKMRGMFEGKDIRTTYLQKFPAWLKKRRRLLLPFYLVLPEAIDLRDYDLVISSSGAWMKGIVTKLNSTHIAYIHSPMRFVWDYNEKYLKDIKKKISIFGRLALSYVRIWDRLAAERPDFLIANSNYTKSRIKKYYRRESEVIFPPAAINDAKIVDEKGDYFVIVSRLSAYKKVDVAVDAFNKLGLPLVVIGEGEQLEYLKSIAKDNIKILGWQNDDVVQNYLQKARAFIFPAEDDFGMTIVEAHSYGVPVLAYEKGGATEIIEEGKTGEFFKAQQTEILADAVRRFIEKENFYDRMYIKDSARKYSKHEFIERIVEFTKSKI